MITSGGTHMTQISARNFNFNCM